MQLHNTAQAAGVRRWFAPHQLRHAHAVEMSREGILLLVIQRQLGQRDLAITALDLPARDRQHRDHPSRPRTTSTDDPLPAPDSPLRSARSSSPEQIDLTNIRG